MTYLLDTTTVSDFAKGVPAVLSRLRATSRAEIAVSVVTMMEVEYGLQRAPARARRLRPVLEALFSDTHALPYELGDALKTAHARAVLRRRGTPIGAYDALIAGTALRHGLIVVTSNLDEFRRVPGLRVEDWRASTASS